MSKLENKNQLVKGARFHKKNLYREARIIMHKIKGYRTLKVYKRLTSGAKIFILSIPNDNSDWRTKDGTNFRMHPLQQIKKYLESVKYKGLFLIDLDDAFHTEIGI